jgi:lysozyme
MNDADIDRLVAMLGVEGCILRSYPDPASDLGRALQQRGLWRAYLYRNLPMPPDLAHLDGRPWTIGYGETRGITEGMVWSREQAEARRRTRAKEFLVGVARICPMLLLEPSCRLVACGSLAYNIGLRRFAISSVRRHTDRGEFRQAADAFRLYRFAKGRAMRGLALRRDHERDVYLEADSD